MFFKRTLMPILVGTLMMGASSLAHAQVAQMSKGMAQFKSASQELVTLYKGAKDTGSVKAMSKKVAAAMKRKADAEAAIQKAMQKLNPKSEKAGKLAEKIFGAMQRQNKAVADAQLASITRAAAVKSKMHKK
ncbi:MAG: hypothetical protein ACI9MU_004289 [Alphaproteobacteria bacterium]|jgi:hypothetical protein